MAQQVRAILFMEDLDSVPSSTWWLTTVYLSSSRRLLWRPVLIASSMTHPVSKKEVGNKNYQFSFNFMRLKFHCKNTEQKKLKQKSHYFCFSTLLCILFWWGTINPCFLVKSWIKMTLFQLSSGKFFFLSLKCFFFKRCFKLPHGFFLILLTPKCLTTERTFLKLLLYKWTPSLI